MALFIAVTARIADRQGYRIEDCLVLRWTFALVCLAALAFLVAGLL